ncbi:unnamed protein product [Miscanthus lutarioriparius]|uniref:Bifunctional inhibitor/plant lipid transfer protein/seed storage helical domain-containing protein n=1 Tax=Miscanthus lutarioriparius TaxID=422564 RepID=A0A811MJN0_9POAL|nr:unnamed protein product [Miscanthus lutarioriparius]
MARWAAVLVLAATAVAMASVAGGDMSADKTECADQLVGLAPCLQYVQGQARAPPPGCCGGLRQVLGKSPKCICVLVRDKDDPGLGIKINATLALALPNACGATRADVSHCARTLYTSLTSPCLLACFIICCCHPQAYKAGDPALLSCQHVHASTQPIKRTV